MAVKSGVLRPEELKMVDKVDEVGTEGSGMSTEQLKEALAKERNERVVLASRELQSVLQKYAVTISPICVIRDNKIFTDVQILPVE